MIKKIRNILYLIDVLYGIGIALFSTTIYLFMEKRGYSIAHINLFMASFWIVSFLAEVPSGVFSDSFGRRNAAILSCIIRGLGLLILFGINGGIILLVISGGLTAIGSALYSGSMSSWAIDEIQKVDPNYDFSLIFSKEKIIMAIVTMVAGYAGAQVVGTKNLGYPIVLSAVVLFVTGIILAVIVKNDNSHKKSMDFSKGIEEYKKTLESSVKFLKENKKFFVVCGLFGCVAFLSTPAFNQWQLYFQNKKLGLISGYIHVFISIFGMIGAYIVSKLKIKNKPRFFMICNFLLFLTLVTSVLQDNLYVALLYFFMHVLILTAEEVIQFTYLNELLNQKTRNSLLSLYYTVDAIITIIIILLSGWICNFVDLGISWIILGGIGIILSIPLSLVLMKGIIGEKYK